MINMEPIGYVHSERKEAIDDNWNSVKSYIELTDSYSEESIAGLQDFSHIEIIYYFNKVDKSKIIIKAEHPRENLNWPKLGIFSQRKKARPNLIGSTMAKIEKIKGKCIYVSAFDAIDETPVLDIKPVIREFLPGEIRQPDWVSELMRNYW